MAPVPPLTPYLVVSDCAAAIAFYKKALGAVQNGEAHTMPGTDKIMHVRLLINGAMIMLADDFGGMRGCSETPEALGGTPITLALQVEDANSFWQTAVDGGVDVTMPLADMFWGDRYGQFKDPFGHKWSVSQTLKQMSDAEMQAAAKETMGEEGLLTPESVTAA
jgi:PhnB protein